MIGLTQPVADTRDGIFRDARRTTSKTSLRHPVTAAEIIDLYADAQRCAESAGLRYVSSEEPGIARGQRLRWV
jgi:hypothetical protein